MAPSRQGRRGRTSDAHPSLSAALRALAIPRQVGRDNGGHTQDDVRPPEQPRSRSAITVHTLCIGRLPRDWRREASSRARHSEGRRGPQGGAVRPTLRTSSQNEPESRGHQSLPHASKSPDASSCHVHRTSARPPSFDDSLLLSHPNATPKIAAVWEDRQRGFRCRRPWRGRLRQRHDKLRQIARCKLSGQMMTLATASPPPCLEIQAEVSCEGGSSHWMP